MLAQYLIQFKLVKTFIRHFWKDHSLAVADNITQYLQKGDSILDLGSGACLITEILKNKGFKVTPVDVVNLSAIEDIKPIIYDGQKLPFKDNSFDVTLLITVLHHTFDPEAILKEAKRVSRKILIIEDIYKSETQKRLTYFMDSILNIDLHGHPHSNKTDSQWKQLFLKLGLKLKFSSSHQFWKFFQSATYLLVKPNS